jgi:hypothetical protein
MPAKALIDVDGTDAVSKVILTLLNEFPGLNKGQQILFATVDETSGIGFYPTSGAAYLRDNESITGHVTQACLYPFSVVYRAAPKSEKQRMRIKEFLDTLGKWLEKLPRALQHVYALFFIIIGWLIFVFEDSAAGWSYLTTMLGANGVFANGTDIYELARNATFLLIAVIACLPAPKRFFYRALERRPRATAAASAALSLVTLTLCVAYLVNSSYNPFLYFRF